MDSPLLPHAVVRMVAMSNGLPPTERPTCLELAALRAVVKLGTTGMAAEELHVSYHTVEWHLHHLKRKARVRHLHQLAVLAIRWGWLEVGELVVLTQPPTPSSRGRAARAAKRTRTNGNST